MTLPGRDTAAPHAELVLRVGERIVRVLDDYDSAAVEDVFSDGLLNVMGAPEFAQSDKLRRVFSFQPLLVGGNPFNTTSIYSLIHYLEREYGVHFAMGGTGKIVEGLKKLMEEEGIEIRLGEEVTHIEVHPTHAEWQALDTSISKARA